MKEIPLTRGKVALVDDDMYDYLMQWKWHYLNGYAQRTLNSPRVNGKSFAKKLAMHRLIMNAPIGMDVDHSNGNRLDNTRLNLRVCTRSQNLRNRGKGIKNTSGYKGVYRHNTCDRWIVSVRINGNKTKYVGLFKDVKDAAIAYNEAAIIHHGEFAKLNQIPT